MKSKNKKDKNTTNMMKVYLFQVIYLCLEFPIYLLLDVYEEKASQIGYIGRIVLLIAIIINALFALISPIVISIKYKFAFKQKGYVFDFFLLIANLFLVVGNSIGFIGAMYYTDLSIVSLIFSIIFNSVSLGVWLIRLLLARKTFKEEKISLSFVIILLFVLINTIFYIYKIKWLAILFLTAICFILFILLMKVLFFSEIKLNTIFKIGIFTLISLFEICLIAFVLYLAFWNPNTEDQSLFNSAMGVYAGILGGLLTLAGVSWTIKHQEKTQKEEEKKKNKPYLSLDSKRIIDGKYDYFSDIFVETSENDNPNLSDDIEKFSGETYITQLPSLYLKNSNLSSCFIEKILINNEVLKIKHRKIIEPEKRIYVKVPKYLKGFCIIIRLIVSDIVGNQYTYNVDFLTKLALNTVKVKDSNIEEINIFYKDINIKENKDENK